MTPTIAAQGALKLLSPKMTRTQTGLLEKKLRNGQICTFSIDVDYWISETLADVHQDRITLGHCPSGQEKALASQLTAAIREVASNPKAGVRTDALGSGQFRVRLPRSIAAYVGLDAPGRTTWLSLLERTAGASITVTSVAVSPGDSWFLVVLLQATPEGATP